MRTAAIALAIVAVLALIPVLINLQTTSSQANEEASPIAGAPQAGAEGAVGADGQAQGQAQNGAAAGDIGTVTEVDKKFLTSVRQAGLWEIPAGRLAQTNASSEAVKRAGHHLIDGHAKLDQLVREDAKLLGVQIPDQATAEQQEWVRQLKAAKGAEFDKLFANVLRASHGKIFAVIGEVRASTQNDLIRRHARQANQTVLDHMEVLEDTGLVDAETFAEVEAAVTK
ncbi:hypothetical protein ADZ36_20965 [Streptomyces fradiae]|uniref:DUF4142 domain-containing protein n=3 Tax=Streptomyces TaxID=1883 RepID=A0A3R7IXA6_9ACTN|nr:hypothetical protein ADZ36_20965 [Streptomyces fradiae]OFA61740.1 hypothetical protein BEN35_01150 [Streptomyces fradiae]PQM24620.1 DUF4142 domain-containing protein [Streptomyces xinghaiensis]RKM98281.1 DUF4142 domain-containing protein [Streptomyces xinghaiensis]RNC75617.1 DUF4142 domain-containing protein [Streptomyces xinghaiensis]